MIKLTQPDTADLRSSPGMHEPLKAFGHVTRFDQTLLECSLQMEEGGWFVVCMLGISAL